MVLSTTILEVAAIVMEPVPGVQEVSRGMVCGGASAPWAVGATTVRHAAAVSTAATTAGIVLRTACISIPFMRDGGRSSVAGG
ncbi:hypothetical protein GCM10010495_73740 [Kitasatospora herbaricolor]|nr:hypothetical protein GCM10010495_73740 [Kitasatospora herbaricolor]